MNKPVPFNPLEKRNLGDSIAQQLLSQPPSVLPPSKRFEGAGIYALYYTGDFEHYLPISHANGDEKWEQPIYVGRATPKGGRKGVRAIDQPAGSVLYDRLREHAKSINQALNLELSDFRCRYLVVDETFISLGEALMIQRFRPFWNLVLDGFGNHDPGGGRKGTLRSLWDTLHPGRSWAGKYVERTDDIEIAQMIAEHLAPPHDFE